MATPRTGGVWLPKSTSNATEAPGSVFASPRLELAFLVSLGVLVVVAHASVNWPLKLPGHHGLEWMALLMFARTMSNERWAALIVATSAAGVSYVPIWGFHETSIGLSYLLTGFVADTLYHAFKIRHATLFGLVGAIAHAVKPVWKWLASFGWGIEFGSVAAGVTTPLVTHLAFGFVGSVAGALAGLALRQKLRQR